MMYVKENAPHNVVLLQLTNYLFYWQRWCHDHLSDDCQFLWSLFIMAPEALVFSTNPGPRGWACMKKHSRWQPLRAVSAEA